MKQNRILSSKKTALQLCSDLKNTSSFYRIFYCGIQNTVISIHTHFLEKKLNISVKDIFVPALYLGAENIWIVTSEEKKYTEKFERKLQKVALLFQMKIYFTRLNN